MIEKTRVAINRTSVDIWRVELTLSRPTVGPTAAMAVSYSSVGFLRTGTFAIRQPQGPLIQWTRWARTRTQGPRAPGGSAPERLTRIFFIRHHKQNGANSNNVL